MAGGGLEAELARPGLERVEDDHRPIDPLAEALEAGDQVEGEAVGRAGGDADFRGDAGLAQSLHPVPDRLARVADAIGIVEEEQVEGGRAEAAEAALGRQPQVVGVGVGAAEGGVGEAGKAARPVALALVEVVADGADQRVVLAPHPGQRPPEQLVGLALAVGVRAQHRRDSPAGPQQRFEALLGYRLAEVEEPPPAPGADRGAAQVTHRRNRIGSHL